LQVIMQYLHPHLEQPMRTLLCPPHLVLRDHPLAYHDALPVPQGQTSVRWRERTTGVWVAFDDQICADCPVRALDAYRRAIKLARAAGATTQVTNTRFLQDDAVPFRNPPCNQTLP
jgi:hypothetical protein